MSDRLPIFSESYTCRSRLHCLSCRDRCGGRDWRSSLAAGFELPVGAPDFACPHGLPWGLTKAPAPVPPPEPPPPARVPLGKWPGWAIALADMRDPDDAGVGDTVHRLLAEGGTAFKATMAVVGVPCGCDERRHDWNAMYPYVLLRG